MIRFRQIAAGLAACLLLSGPARADDLLIFAAASLSDALSEVGAAWDGTPPVISYAGSSALARQIEAGAPADIFVSANEAWTDHLAEGGHLVPDRTRVLLANRLVLAGRKVDLTPAEDLAGALAALPGDARIAAGLLEAVPAGLYARQTLEALGLLDAWLPRIAQVENVRIALALVTRGEVARAIVYRTDALSEPSIGIEVLIPADLHDPIRYPAAVTTRSTHPDAAAFLAFLASPEAMAIFGRHGFESVE